MSHDEAHPNAAYDWEDPHHFHHGEDAESDHDHDGHHVTPWQLLVAILMLLLALTALTIFSAEAERWAIALGIHISHFWNVMIALSIALVKAIFVCMFFMHLKHDSPINTMVLLTTLFVFGLFILLTGIDLNERDAINDFKAGNLVAGGTGTGVAPAGGNFGQTITNAVKQRHIDAKAIELATEHGHLNDKGEPAPTEDDTLAAERAFWADFYHHKFEDHPGHTPSRHSYDTNDYHAQWAAHHIETHGDHHISTASTSVARHGLTPGLFDTDAHQGEHDAGHAEPAEDH
jgi:caa(3)-type oxidase subunit IV